MLRAAPWARSLVARRPRARRGGDRHAHLPGRRARVPQGRGGRGLDRRDRRPRQDGQRSPDGKPTSFVGVGAGGWFGEGSLLKDEPRRYDIVALRESAIAYMPRATFMWLLDTSMPFNRFLLTQLNERLGQFIGMVEHDRLLGPDARLARCLAVDVQPASSIRGSRRTLPISQEEIAQLAGLSRQRANQALQRLEQAGLLRIDYGGITVIDLPGLREFED